MFKALGFESPKAENEHVYVFVKGRPPKDIDLDVQKYLDFGITNEMHAVSTLVGCIMPAFSTLLYILGMWSIIHSWRLQEKSDRSRH